ncbi:MAG: GH92 family glycosyl hydrolase [Bacteroidales bacterium]|nr:GH92 family glycosyl hydrolase [Bacteroidales bacterium]
MNLKFIFPFLLILLVCSSCGQKNSGPADYVNPYIGNISHLLVPTFPTVHLPNSMLRFYPDRGDFTAYKMQGFPLNIPSHRSGRVFSLMPFTGKPEDQTPNLMYTYDNEEITPYSYSVHLDEHDIRVRFAPSERSGFFSLEFPDGKEHGIILRTRGRGSFMIGENGISGYDTYNGVKVWLFFEPDRMPDHITGLSEAERNRMLTTGSSVEDNRTALLLSFPPDNTGVVNIRYGLSYISAGQAEENMKNDIGSRGFTEVAGRAKEIWNSVLSRIEVEGGTEDQRTVFYTSLYRCHERMIDITENGQYYSAWSGRTEPASDTAFYTDDWVWDTWLALHPLQVILNPSRQDEKITSYIRMARQSGWMPTFPTISGDNHAMNGNHSVAVILDAWNKGIRNFDLEEAYYHLKHTILSETKLPWVRGNATWFDEFYDRNGYFPGLQKGEAETLPEVHSFEKRQSVAVTLAASYDDWCMAQIAGILDKEDDHDFFLKRSLNHRNLFNKETGFYHPRDKDGNWVLPFDYRIDGGMGARDYYDENNGWTYIWQPYHAFDDLIYMLGGIEGFDNRLDQFFSEGLGSSKWIYYSTMPDATGNVGQFVMGNEPSMHIPYLYNLAGKPWKTQKRVRMLMDTWFRNDLMGVPGDEDGGGLSAFYVFSAMGFYPITPGIPEYQIGSPLFKKIKINLENGKSFTVVARNNSQVNRYILSATLNGEPLNKTVITHNDIIEGGTLVLEMGEYPDYKWGSDVTIHK